ncbi:MAG: hypothetical protein Q9166_000054 [cf. Caloplaca sp. 2 TL-2023]
MSSIFMLTSEKIPTQHEWYMMKFCRYVCAGTTSGAVHFLDPDTLLSVKTWQAHSAKISDMDAQDSYLVTCGWSTRPYGPPTLESFAKVYDLKKLEQLPPIPFHGGAAFVQMHPKLSTTSIISSMSGQLQVANILDPNTSNLLQANLGNYMSQSHLVLAPSGAAWALADIDGVIQIWAASLDKLRFTESAAPTEFAGDVFPLPFMGIDADIPFSAVGMPYYREKLLSVWPEDQIYELGFPPPRIDPDVIKHMAPSSIGFRAANPRKILRNQIDRISIVDSHGMALTAPRFLSEKSREANGEPEKERRISDAEAFTNPELAGSTKADVPVMYRLMEIKYSRYGVDDFDFGLQLTEETSPQSTLEVRIQAANRFLLKQIGLDYQRIAIGDDKLDQVTDQRQNVNPRMRGSTPAFSRILKDSFECEISQRMCLNKQSDARQLWSVLGWLPERIGLVIEKGRLLCLEGEALRASQRNRQSRLMGVYDLVGLVADVNSGEHQKSHMVSLVNVGISSRDRQVESQWHLFNDFLVRKVDREEALRFGTTWKTPTILTYQHQGASNAIDDSWKDSLDTSCLFMNWSLNPYSVRPQNWPCVLDPSTEQPEAGTHMPIDTEFVQLQQEEIEILATGDRQVVRPTREGLARVSVLRANGPNEGLPFIDDYISIPEPVVDYVTKYSGVSAGDLDPGLSVHPLVPLKVAYKKLWLLLNLDCIFVGHGLTKDFRNINMFVPKSQMVDTVTLFYNPTRSKRNLSLRFLAWYLLKENIQSETHDSIEDAFTALKLWRKYQEFEDAGILEKMIDEIYTAGRKWNYKVPEKGSEKWPGVLTVNKGRETPDIDSGVSRPTTPTGKKHGGSEFFESPLNVRRSGLRSRSSSLESVGSNDGVKDQWRRQLDYIYQDDIVEQQKHDTKNPIVEPQSTIDEANDASYEFNLFSQKPRQSAVSGPQRPKVLLRSPSPETKEPGFVRPARSSGYYFTVVGTEEEQMSFRDVAVEGVDVIRESQVKWPGSELPWRVTTITINPAKRAIVASNVLEAAKTGKRKKLGKKRRIAIRTELQAQKAREEAVRLAEAEKGTMEMEKRKRRNREKKLKRREKARNLKKGEEVTTVIMS